LAIGYSSRLNSLTLLTHVRDDFIKAMLVDDAHALVRNAQANPAILGLEPTTLAVQVWQKPTARLVMGVRNVISALRTLSRDLTDLGHDT